MAFADTPARKLLPHGAAIARPVADAGISLDPSSVWQLLKAKAAELAAFFASLVAALAKKVEELFPPEARSEALRVAITVVLPAALGALVLLCLARCCWRCCCAGCRGRGGRMMKAPGRGGARMPRSVFEDDPRGYFVSLRAGKALVY